MKNINSVMQMAHNLQAVYTSVGSPSSQNVRNPFPMKDLILAVLPELPDPTNTVYSDISFPLNGKNYVKKGVPVNVGAMFGKEYYVTNGLTIDQIIAKFKKNNWIYNAATINSMLGSRERFFPMVKSVNTPKIPNKRGRTKSCFFKVSSTK